ncbi:hypothetical protein OJAV_G00109360 [Oryzias javanicus]|uniref:LIM zinc-binding domain-containing protein n=1 Tax=Oryzias javanicus TaxID=123683 RepID=A0A437CV23_ORYJA|nr:hypothetical protein OJAV_G00109360 [Oryzias javanicus]
MNIQYEDPALSGSYGVVGSFPKSFGYGGEEQDLEESCPPADKPRILLMGLRRSGKSSIQKVVFHKMSPNETLFLESTNKIYKDDISSSSFVNFQIWDFPGQVDFFDPTFDSEMIFKGTGALIFVIDAQDDYMEALGRLHLTVSRAFKVNPDINFEVFIHKVDGLSDDHKIETQRDIHQRANDDLADASLEKLHLSFYLTSIYDHSIFEAFSKVVQKLIPQLPTLENLLNIFISHSAIEKAFLFDVVSKIYIATDSSPVDMQSYELCCDMIDVVIDVSCIYGLMEDGSGCAYDKESLAIIKLNNTTVLYLKEVTKFLALVCILREESFERKGLIDYNFHCFRKAIHEVFEVGSSFEGSTNAAGPSSAPERTGGSIMSERFDCKNCKKSLYGQQYIQVENEPHCITCYEGLHANTCQECKEIIGHNAKELAFEDRYYHDHCFRCFRCDRTLADESFTSQGDVLLCSDCYCNEFSSKCVSCDKTVMPGSKILEFDGSSWHEDCFVCHSCEKPIGGEAFVPNKNQYYCVPCYEGRFTPRCSHCNKALTKGGVTYKDEVWHRECFLCAGCSAPLAGQPFTSQGETPYCVKCFSSLYGKKCAACNSAITGFGDGKYISFEDRQWHQPCFKCSRCSVSLVGSGFFPYRDQILCTDCNNDD